MLRFFKLNQYTLIAILFLVCSITHAEDLSEIFNIAINTDAVLLQALANEEAIKELLPQARSNLLPIVDGTANTTYTNTNNPQIERYNTYLYGVTLTAPILNLASWFQYRQVDDQIKSAIATYEDTRQDLIVRVVNQYFTILKALDDLIFARSERKTFFQHLEDTKQKFNAGVIAITDVHVAQARYDGAVAQEIRATNALHDQQEIMGEITGFPAKNVYVLKDNIKLHNPFPDDIEQWVNAAIKQNFDLQAKRYDIASAKKNISIQRAGHYPTIVANGASNVSKSVPPSPVRANTNTIGVTVNLPIFNAGNIVAQTRQAAYAADLAIQKEIQAQRTVVSNVRQAFRGIVTQLSQIKALQQTVISSKSALDATQAAFEVGTRTITDVLNAQTELLQAQNDLSKSRYDYIIESFKLKRFSGSATVEDVNIINQWLQPPPKGMYPVDNVP